MPGWPVSGRARSPPGKRSARGNAAPTVPRLALCGRSAPGQCRSHGSSSAPIRHSTPADQVHHVPDRLLETDHDGPGDDSMADDELLDLPEIQEPADVLIVQAVTGGDAQPQLMSHFHRVLNANELLLSLPEGMGLAESAGMDLDVLRLHPDGRFDLVHFWAQEETDDDVGVAHHADQLFQHVLVELGFEA